jgi:hypothetical protein
MQFINQLLNQITALFGVVTFFGDVNSLVKYERMPTRMKNVKHYNIRDGF